MLRSLTRYVLALTALAPVLLMWAVAGVSAGSFGEEHGIAVLIAVLLGFLCWAILQASGKMLPEISFKPIEVKAVDNEVIGYVVTYLFPLITPNGPVTALTLGFVVAVLAAVLATSHAFTFNPVLTLFRYHFYEVKCSTGITYLVLSRRDIDDVSDISSVKKISNYLMLGV